MVVDLPHHSGPLSLSRPNMRQKIGVPEIGKRMQVSFRLSYEESLILNMEDLQQLTEIFRKAEILHHEWSKDDYIKPINSTELNFEVNFISDEDYANAKMAPILNPNE